MQIKNFNPKKEAELLQWLESQVGFENFLNGLERGLERIRPFFLEFLDCWKGKILTVAGTNGKGETSLFIGEYLKQNNKTYSLWTSPHILSIKERFRTEEGEISYEDLEKYFNFLKQKENDLQSKLSYYEFLFLIFIINAKERKSDYLILEVGLGGRLDAVNLFDASVVGLTSIGRDHQKILGNSLKLILIEKLGVLRKQQILFSAFESLYLRSLAKKYSFEHFAFHIDLAEAKIINAKDSFTIRNKKMAKLMTQEVLDRGCFNNVSLDRFPKVINNLAEFHFENAHNPDSFRFMVNKLCAEGKKWDGILLSFSERSQSDLESMMKTLLAYAQNNVKIYLASFKNHKSLSGEKIYFLKNNFLVEWVEDWKSFLERESHKNKKILITGSNYFIGDVYKYFYS